MVQYCPLLVHCNYWYTAQLHCTVCVFVCVYSFLRTCRSFIFNPHRIITCITHCMLLTTSYLHAYSDNVHCLPLLLFVAAYCAVYFCCRTPSSLLFAAKCYTVYYLVPHATQSLFVGATCHTVAIGFIPFVATCCTVYYSLPCSVQLLLVLHTVQFTSVAALRTVQYSLPHAMQFAICCCKCHTVCYWLPCAVQLLCVNTCRIVCYLLLLSAATCRTVAMCCCILCSHYSVAACGLVAIYILLHAVHLPFVATGVGASICCRMPDSCYLLLLRLHKYMDTMLYVTPIHNHYVYHCCLNVIAPDSSSNLLIG